MTGRRWLAHLFYLLLLGLVTGCIAIAPQTNPQKDQKALALIEQAKTFNSDIKTSKGVGRLMLKQGDQKEYYKMAWAAQTPNRLRLTLLLSGHPVETIAASGDWVYFISHTGRHKRHSAVSTDPDLDFYINIPVRLPEMISLLLGQIPIRSFDRAWMSPEAPNLVMATGSFSPHFQELQFDESGRVLRYRLLNTNKELVFGIWYAKFKEKDGFDLPSAITIRDKSGRSLDISLAGLTPNVKVKESTFRLTGSGS